MSPLLRPLRISACMLCASLLAPLAAHAQETEQPRLVIRPHCEESTGCPSYDVRDPLSVQTPELHNGDTLDIDIVLHNPQKLPVERFRAWLAYDPAIFTNGTVAVHAAFPTPTPGESSIDADEGMIKLSGTAQQRPADAVIVLARVTLAITQPQTTGSPITFYDNPDTPEPETSVFAVVNDTEINLVTPPHGYLFVRLAMDGSDSPSPAASSSAASSPASSASSAPALPATVFTMLQVQGLRVTTEGSTVYLAWDALPSADLIGYHLYYGTESGRYLQRRAIDAGATSVSIRALPEGTTYYFAIRGVNAAEQETDFSREVGVNVGNPRTSTAPFTAGVLPPPTPGTDGTVAGETGTASTLAILLLFSAAIGTFVAFRRQLSAQHAPLRP